MIYIFNKQKIFLMISLVASQTIKSMNIPGDVTPINISSHKYHDEWSLMVPGKVPSEVYDYKNDSISANEFFHDITVTTSVGASMLGAICK